MGYTHYWYRDKEIKPGTYRAIVDDFRKLLSIFDGRASVYVMALETANRLLTMTMSVSMVMLTAVIR